MATTPTAPAGTEAPRGARPGPSSFRARPPQWTPGPSDAPYPVEYATIEVPRDYTDPSGPALTLALSRRPALDPARRRGILLAVNGGPGGDWGLGRELPGEFAGTRVHEVYDLIGFDPRGTGASTPLQAQVTVPRAPFDSRPPDEVFGQLAEDMRLREEGCARAGGSLRPHISTRNTARDMDAIRAALGEDRLNFVGYAYGSYVGAVYGSMFPDRTGRTVLDSCVHPGWTWREQFLRQGDAVLGNVRIWADWTGERAGRFGLGACPAAVLEAVEEVAAGLDALTGTPALRTLFDGAVGNRAADRAQWAELADQIAGVRDALRDQDAERAGRLLSAQSTWRAGDSEGDLRCGVLEAITLEHAWPQDLETYYSDMRAFRARYPYGYGVLRAQPWVGAFRAFQAPEAPTELSRRGYPAGLVVQADGDPMDHYEGGVAMAERLGHRLLTVTDCGGHEIYALGGNPAVDAVVEDYLADGVLPAPGASVPGTAARPAIPPSAG